MNCPFCKGSGQRSWQDFAGPEGLRTWSCDFCNGTGDFEKMKLVRACRLGEAQGYARAEARILLVPYDSRPLGFETIEGAVIDDLRRQRYEEMLMPLSAERLRIEAKIEQYERERGPLLAYLGSLVDELREQVHAELPMPR
jgi:hypothetical protein